MKHFHQARLSLRKEVADWRLWWGRGVVVALAVVAGLTVVGFTSLCERASALFAQLDALWWWSPLLAGPACAAAVVWCTRRYAPRRGRLGHPPGAAEPPARGLFVSLRVTLAKIGLTAAGLLGGLSLGREAPSVQIAAGVMLQARRLMPAGGAVNTHGLLVAGGAAGIAAAFNTPLAGVMFAIE